MNNEIYLIVDDLEFPVMASGASQSEEYGEVDWGCIISAIIH